MWAGHVKHPNLELFPAQVGSNVFIHLAAMLYLMKGGKPHSTNASSKTCRVCFFESTTNFQNSTNQQLVSPKPNQPVDPNQPKLTDWIWLLLGRSSLREILKIPRTWRAPSRWEVVSNSSVPMPRSVVAL